MWLWMWIFTLGLLTSLILFLYYLLNPGGWMAQVNEAQKQVTVKPNEPSSQAVSSDPVSSSAVPSDPASSQPVDESISPGSIAGIVVGSVALLLLFAGGIHGRRWFIAKKNDLLDEANNAMEFFTTTKNGVYRILRESDALPEDVKELHSYKQRHANRHLESLNKTIRSFDSWTTVLKTPSRANPDDNRYISEFYQTKNF